MLQLPQLPQLPQLNHLRALEAGSPSHPLPPCTLSRLPHHSPRPLGLKGAKTFFYEERWSREKQNSHKTTAAP